MLFKYVKLRVVTLVIAELLVYSASVWCMHCDRMEEFTVNISVLYHNAIILLFWYQKCLVRMSLPPKVSAPKV